MSTRHTKWVSSEVCGYWLHVYREDGRWHLCLEHDPSGRSYQVF